MTKHTLLISITTVAFLIAFPCLAAFDSGSNGSDGPLDLTTPGVIEMNPSAMGLDADGDHVFYFTTIHIGAGVTVQLTGRYFNGPVYWLASGAVTIDGTIDLNGQDGQSARNYQSAASRVPAIPGAGGYPGGIGGFGSFLPQAGSGPGGGGPGGRGDPSFSSFYPGCDAGHATVGRFCGGPAYGNSFLVPLIGGSGGGGAFSNSIIINGNNVGGGGGAGGGAIYIASSQSIALNGIITAQGGNGRSDIRGYPGGHGSGGAIRIIANDIQGSGQILAFLVFPGGDSTTPGRIRLEAFNNKFTGTVNPTPTFAIPYRTSYSIFVPTTPPPALFAISVDGNLLPAQPSGSFQFPDVTINQAQAVSVKIGARNIPLGTIVKLHVLSESGTDQTIDSSPVAGTLANSTATATVVLPPASISRGFLRAVWTP